MAKSIQGKGLQVYNNLRNGMTSEAKNLLPVANKNNVGDIANIFRSNPNLLNQFIGAISNKVTETMITSIVFEHPLSMFKKKSDQLGNTVEEVYVALTKEHVYNPVAAETEVFKREIPDIQAAYHVRNRESMYTTNVTDEQMMSAFQSWTSFENMVTTIVRTLTQSNERDEYHYIRDLATVAYNNNHMSLVEIGDLNNTEDFENLVSDIKYNSRKLTFPNRKTPTGVENATPIDRQIILISAYLESRIDVKVLAMAFNMSKSEFLARRVVVDEFSDPNIEAILVDENFFIVRESVRQQNSIYNPRGLYTNHFLHVWQTLSYSLFNNAVAFVHKIPTELNQKLIVHDPVQVVGGYGITTSSTKFEIQQYEDLAPGQTWAVSVTSSNTSISANVVDDHIDIVVSPDAEPGVSVDVTVTAKVIDGVGKDVSDAPTIATIMTVQVSRYINVK